MFEDVSSEEEQHQDRIVEDVDGESGGSSVFSPPFSKTTSR